MQKKKLAVTVPETDETVHLGPKLGMRPGVYLAGLYSIALLLIIFFTLFYPGISNPGAMALLNSEPSGAAVRIDDVYAGSTPCSVFVPEGRHVFELVLPGFSSEQQELSVQGRIFASALFPKKIPINVHLQSKSPVNALALAAADFAQWTFGGEPTQIWQIPLSLSEGVYRTGPNVSRAETDALLCAAARFAVTNASIRDLLRAQFLASGAGNPPSPLALISSAAEIIQFLNTTPNSALWLADTLIEENQYALTASAWYQNQLTANAERNAEETLASQRAETVSALPASQIRLGGLMFTEIASGILVQGNPFPFSMPVESFLICATVVPFSVYEDFINANPQWMPDQRDALTALGLTSTEYLTDYSNIAEAFNQKFDGRNTVSWHAAEAFCKWLEKSLPDSFSGWEIRLPFEHEWEYAAKSVLKWENPGVKMYPDINVWEWCQDYYSPLPFIHAPASAVNAVGSPERIVRGGSFVNRAGTGDIETRAFLPPENCSPFVSFRPVIARKKTDM
ncbi:MAG: SUMF1/EgtB/PvdO family nonheme iron enzyme [Treponema sp.]|nr:SUMF1/EgtB/PvdO family nonheme iron enzyme [Treponema sp.]